MGMKGLATVLPGDMGAGQRGRGHCTKPGGGQPKTGDMPGDMGMPIMGTGLMG